MVLAMLYRERGDREALERIAKFVGRTETPDAQVRDFALVGQAVVAQARGQHREALEIGLPQLPASDPTSRPYVYREAIGAAWAVGAHDEVERLVARIHGLPSVMAPPSLRAHASRYAGLLAASRGDPAAGVARLDAAIQTLRELGYRYETACVVLERGEILLDGGSTEQAASDLREARIAFAQLGARPMLERLERIAGARPAPDEAAVARASAEG
jgi:hypothetical protein